VKLLWIKRANHYKQRLKPNLNLLKVKDLNQTFLYSLSRNLAPTTDRPRNKYQNWSTLSLLQQQPRL
jgi:hypothetical protein